MYATVYVFRGVLLNVYMVIDWDCPGKCDVFGGKEGEMIIFQDEKKCINLKTLCRLGCETRERYGHVFAEIQ